MARKKENWIDKIDRILTKTSTKPYKLAKAGTVTAIFGALIKATVITETFPKPWDLIGNIILFISIIIIVFDIAKGGLLD